MKKIVLSIGMAGVLFISYGQADSNFVIPKKKREKRVSYSQLQEEIADCYGRIIQQQSTITSLMAATNNSLVTRTRELFEGTCNATTQQLIEHRDKLSSFEKELNSFAARSCTMRDCLGTSL